MIRRESGNRSIVKHDLAAIRKNAGYNPRVTAFKKYGGKLNTNDPVTPIVGTIFANAMPDPIMLKEAAQDPMGTLKGAAEVASLASPLANAYRGYKFVTGQGGSVTGADMQDVNQAIEVAGILPYGKIGKAGKIGFDLAKYGVDAAPSMIREAAPMIRAANPILGKGVVRQGRSMISDATDYFNLGDYSGMTSNARTKALREGLAQARELGQKVSGGTRAEQNLASTVLHGRLSRRARAFPGQYDFNPITRARTKVASIRQQGRKVSAEREQQIMREEANRTKREERRLVDDAKINFPDEFKAAYDAGGIEEVLNRFQLDHTTAVAKGGKLEYSNVRLVPTELHAGKGDLPAAGRYKFVF